MPFPERGGIKAITEPKQLYQETVTMRHCVSMYLSRIVKGDVFIYHISFGEGEEKEQATLAIQKKGEHWLGTELKGIRNQKVSSELRRFVLDWLEDFDSTLIAD